MAMTVGELQTLLKLDITQFSKTLKEAKALGDAASRGIGKSMQGEITKGLQGARGLGKQIGNQIGNDLRSGVGGAAKGIKGDLGNALRGLNFKIDLGPLSSLNTSFSAIGLVAGTALGAASAAITGLGAAMSGAVDEGRAFETQMSAVAAVAFTEMGMESQAAQEQFKALSDQAIELGSTTTFTATQVGQAQELLARAGFSVNETLQATPGLLAAAAAEGLDLATTADIASSALRGFGLSASDMTMVADTLAQTSATSNASITGLGESFKYIAPVAQTVKLNFVEVNAALGLLANNGIKGSVAGRNLASGLMSLASPSQEAAALMKELGLSVSDAEGNFKSLPTLFGEIQAATNGMTDAQKLSAVATLVGKDNAKTYLTMLTAQYKAVENGKEVTLSGADALRVYSDALAGSAGAAEKMASIRLDNLDGDIEAFTGAISSLQIAIFQALNPALRAVVQGATEFVRMFGPPIIAAIQQVMSVIQGVAMQVLPNFAKAWQALAPAISSIMPIIGQLAGFFAGLASQAVVWGSQIVAQLAGGMAQAINTVVSVLKQIGAIIRYWLQPNSPPKIVPELDQYGSDAGQLYVDSLAQVDPNASMFSLGGTVKGIVTGAAAEGLAAAESAGAEIGNAFARGMQSWSASDFGNFNELSGQIEDVIRDLGESGAMAKEAVVPAIQASRSAVQSIIDDIREFGSVTDETMQEIAGAMGGMSPEVEGLISAYADLAAASAELADAQAELNRVTEEYAEKITPLQKELDAINNEQEKIRDMQRIEKLQEDLASGKLDENEARLAELEIQEIQKKQQLDAIESEKDAALEAAQSKVDAAAEAQAAAQAQYDAAKAQIEAQQENNALMREQVQILKELADAQKNAAGAAGGGGGLGGALGGGLDMGGMPEIPELDPSALSESMAGVDELVGSINRGVDSVSAFTQGFSDSQTAVIAFKDSILEGTGPIGAFGGIITEIGNFVNTYLIPPFNTFATIVRENIIPSIQTLVETIVTQFQGNAGPAITSFNGIIQTMQPIFEALYLGVQGFILGLLGVINGLVVGVTAAIPGMAAVIQGSLTTIQGFVQLLSGTFSGFVDLIANLIAGNWAGVWESAAGIYTNAVDSILTIAQGLWEGLNGIVGGIAAFIVGFFEGAYESITGQTANWTGGIIQFFANLRTDGVAKIEELKNLIINSFNVFTTTVLGTVGKWVTDTVAAAIKMKDDFIAAVNDLYTQGVAKFEEFKTTASGKLEEFKTYISGLGPAMLTAALGIGSSIIDGIVQGLNIDKISAKVQEIANSIPDGIKKLLGIKSPSRVMIQEVGLPVAEGISTGMDQGRVFIQYSVKLISNAVIGGLTKVRDDAIVLFQSMSEVFAGELDDLNSKLDSIKAFESLLPDEDDLERSRDQYEQFTLELTDLQQDIADMDSEVAQQRVDIANDLAETLADIEQKIVDAKAKADEKIADLQEKKRKIDEKIAKEDRVTGTQARIQEEINKLQGTAKPGDVAMQERIAALKSKFDELEIKRQEDLADLLEDRDDVNKDLADAQKDRDETLADLEKDLQDEKIEAAEKLNELETKYAQDREDALSRQLELLQQIRDVSNTFNQQQNLFNQMQALAEAVQTATLAATDQLKGLAALDPSRASKFTDTIRDGLSDVAKLEQELLQARADETPDIRRIKLLEDQLNLTKQAATAQLKALQQGEIEKIQSALGKESDILTQIAEEKKRQDEAEKKDDTKLKALEAELALLQAQKPLLQEQLQIITGLDAAGLSKLNVAQLPQVFLNSALPQIGTMLNDLVDNFMLRTPTQIPDLFAQVFRSLTGAQTINNQQYIVNGQYNVNQSALDPFTELRLLQATRR